MLKLIILNNDLETIKNICNQIINEIPDVQLSGFCTTLEEFDNLFDKVNPNIIMMNYSDYINSRYTENFKPRKLKIIFFNLQRLPRNSQTQLYISQKSNLTHMKESIKRFISTENKRVIHKKIVKFLELFHFNFKLIGTTFLIESILYCYENRQDYVFENLERNVYPEVAKLFRTNAEHIKWTISHSIKSINSHLTPQIRKQLSEKFNLDFSEKLTPKQLINTILSKLQ